MRRWTPFLLLAAFLGTAYALRAEPAALDDSTAAWSDGDVLSERPASPSEAPRLASTAALVLLARVESFVRLEGPAATPPEQRALSPPLLA